MRRSAMDWPFGSRSANRRGWARDSGASELPRRWARPQEPWEAESEPFEGATVLEDLALCVGDDQAAAAVLARYVAVRVVLQAAEGRLGGLALEVERRAAAEYVPLAEPAERPVLGAMIRLASRRPSPALLAALNEAGERAAARGHSSGAFSLHRTCYRLALGEDRPAEAARAASAIARLAEAGGGRWSARLWRRRAAVLTRRAAARDH